MKRLYLLLFAFVAAWTASANPISKESAQQKAAKFINKDKALARGRQKIELVSAPGEYFVFNIENNRGFVIVSGDDTTPDILGYGKNGAFDPQNIPDNMRSFLKGLREQIKAIQNGAKAAPKNTVSGGAIVPLLGAIQYNQGNPYNLLCPDIPITINGELNKRKGVTGCVATAMAQLIKYWQYPNQTSAIPGYNLNFKAGEGTYSVEVPKWDPTTLDWANMLPSYNGNETNDQIIAVATLLSLCGTSVKMKYNTGSSNASSSDVPNALITYFGYDEGIREIYRLQYRAAEWNQKIYDELNKKRPVLYSGQSTGGGHSFIVDGYDSDDFFHVNWGWGGYQDNYFLLSVLDPEANAGIGASSSSDGYSYGQSAIIGIQPPTGIGPTPEPMKMSSNSLNAMASKYTRTNSSENFSITIENAAWNWTGNTRIFDTAIGVFDSDDKIVKVHELYSNHNYDPNYGYNQSITFQFGAGLPDGIYSVYAISRESGTSTWLKNNNSNNYFLVGIIEGNNLIVKTPSEAIGFKEASITAIGKTEVGSMVPLLLSLKGSDYFFNKEVFLFINGIKSGGKVVEVETGKDATVSFGFIPETAGSYSIDAAFESDGKYNTIASNTITISNATENNLDIKATVSNVNENNYVIGDNKIIIKLSITNYGSSTYDNLVGVDLYKSRDDGSGYGDGVGSRQEEIILEPGKTTEIEFTFDNLQKNANYFFYSFYYSGGNKEDIWGRNVSLADEEPATANLSIESDADYNNEYVITKNKLNINVRVKNESSSVYDNVIEVGLYKLIPGTNSGSRVDQQKEAIKLAAGASTSLKFTFESLENGDSYFYIVSYYSKGEKQDGYSSNLLSVEFSESNIPGDANGDGEVDAKDIVDIINYMMGMPTSTGTFDEDAADANGDGTINTADIVTIVNTIMAK